MIGNSYIVIYQLSNGISLGSEITRNVIPPSNAINKIPPRFHRAKAAKTHFENDPSSSFVGSFKQFMLKAEQFLAEEF